MNTTLRALLRSLALTAHYLCALAFLVLAAPMCAAATYYVAPSGNDNNTGGQGDPYLTIQNAISNASSGDTVVVQAGTYSGLKNVDIDFQGRNLTLVAPSGAAATMIDCAGSSSAVHRGFYLHSGEGAHGTLVIDGFTIKNGYSNGGNSRGGGGVYVASGDTVTIQNCTFTGCTCTDNGGGIDNEGTVTLPNCTFDSDTASYGAAVYNNGPLTVTSGTFTGNMTGNGGGGIYNSGTSVLTLTQSKFANNSASYGAGFYNNNGVVTVTNCTLTGNTDNGYGGAGLYSDGGTLTITSSTFTSNIAKGGNGGAIRTNQTTLSMTACTVSYNASNNNNGGGLELEGYSSNTSTLTNCLLIGNSAGGNGGGIHNSGPTLSLNYDTVSLNVCNNNGGGLYVDNGTAKLTDDILYNDTGGEAVDGTSGQTAIMASYCDILGGYAGTGVFDKNPLFVNPAAGDFHLKTGSPCIGKGTPITGVTTDLDGKTRGNPPTIGAYEGAVVAVTSHTHILWTNPDGRAVLWDSDANGAYTDHGQYGPYTDQGGTWKAVALATGPNGVSRLLWANPDGRMVLWYVNPDGTHGDGGQYGPYPDAGGVWRATTVSVGPDNLPHILWTNPDGREVLWDGNAGGAYTDHGQYGPYTDSGGTWRAVTAAIGPDNLPHLLWDNPDGRSVLWNGNPDGTYSDHGQYGPYTDAGGTWNAITACVGPDNLPHLLWNNPDGRAVLWNGNAGGTYTDHGQYGPYTDSGGTWKAAAVAVGPDDLTHLLWTNPDGRAVLWNGNAGGTYSDHGQYGPYTDSGGTWRATATSAGP